MFFHFCCVARFGNPRDYPSRPPPAAPPAIYGDSSSSSAGASNVPLRDTPTELPVVLLGLPEDSSPDSRPPNPTPNPRHLASNRAPPPPFRYADSSPASSVGFSEPLTFDEDSMLRRVQGLRLRSQTDRVMSSAFSSTESALRSADAILERAAGSAFSSGDHGSAEPSFGRIVYIPDGTRNEASIVERVRAMGMQAGADRAASSGENALRIDHPSIVERRNRMQSELDRQASGAFGSADPALTNDHPSTLERLRVRNQSEAMALGRVRNQSEAMALQEQLVRNAAHRVLENPGVEQRVRDAACSVLEHPPRNAQRTESWGIRQTSEPVPLPPSSASPRYRGGARGVSEWLDSLERPPPADPNVLVPHPGLNMTHYVFHQN